MWWTILTAAASIPGCDAGDVKACDAVITEQTQALAWRHHNGTLGKRPSGWEFAQLHTALFQRWCLAKGRKRPALGPARACFGAPAGQLQQDATSFHVAGTAELLGEAAPYDVDSWITAGRARKLQVVDEDQTPQPWIPLVVAHPDPEQRWRKQVVYTDITGTALVPVDSQGNAYVSLDDKRTDALQATGDEFVLPSRPKPPADAFGDIQTLSGPWHLFGPAMEVDGSSLHQYGPGVAQYGSDMLVLLADGSLYYLFPNRQQFVRSRPAETETSPP